LILGIFFRRSAVHKQRVSEKQNVEIDSPERSGGHGKYGVSWPPLEAALSVFKFSRFLLTTVFEKELIKTMKIAFNAE
jgi:hypothetical protein